MRSTGLSCRVRRSGLGYLLTEQLREWLDEQNVRISENAQEAPDLAELLEMFAQRKREQQERHDGGPYWIGTGGKSQLGQGATRSRV